MSKHCLWPPSVTSNRQEFAFVCYPDLFSQVTLLPSRLSSEWVYFFSRYLEIAIGSFRSGVDVSFIDTTSKHTLVWNNLSYQARYLVYNSAVSESAELGGQIDGGLR